MFEQLWKHAMRHIAEVALEGLSQVKGCTGVGRTAMTSDLQDLSYSLKSILASPSQEMAASLETSLRIVDTYIKVPPPPFPTLSPQLPQKLAV
jgi:hypothetical protein